MIASRFSLEPAQGYRIAQHLVQIASGMAQVNLELRLATCFGALTRAGEQQLAVEGENWNPLISTVQPIFSEVR